MTDNLADYESELVIGPLPCSYRECNEPSTHRVVHSCGWGALSCDNHARQFLFYMPMLRATAAAHAAEGRKLMYCLGCSKVPTYDGDFTVEEIIT